MSGEKKGKAAVQFFVQRSFLVLFRPCIRIYRFRILCAGCSVYRKIRAGILCFIILLWQAGAVCAASMPKETELYAKSAVLMDGDSGRILYEKNGFEALANASTTKILTCILALENCEPESVAAVSAYAAAQPKVRLGMREGQKFYLKDMLYGLMLESFNDCAVVIAEHIAGDVTGFAGLMNQKAQEIGCEDSYFITPNGLDGKDEQGIHHTTAADLAKIMRYCIKLSPKAEQFLEITGTADYAFMDAEGKSSYQCSNHNAFLQMMDGAFSGKTGFTGNAGYCYVGALKRDDRTYIVALLACGWPNNKTYKWSDTKKLMAYGIEHFRKQDLRELRPDMEKLQPVAVEMGQGDFIGERTWVTPAAEAYEGCETLLLGEGEEITLRYEVAEQLFAPVEKGACIGEITYMLGADEIGRCRVVAENTIKKIDFYWCFLRIFEQLLFAN